jgi:hypothetical protein
MLTSPPNIPPFANMGSYRCNRYPAPVAGARHGTDRLSWVNLNISRRTCSGATATAGYGLKWGAIRVIGCLWLYAGILEYLQHFARQAPDGRGFRCIGGGRPVRWHCSRLALEAPLFCPGVTQHYTGRLRSINTESLQAFAGERNHGADGTADLHGTVAPGTGWPKAKLMGISQVSRFK